MPTETKNINIKADKVKVTPRSRRNGKNNKKQPQQQQQSKQHPNRNKSKRKTKKQRRNDPKNIMAEPTNFPVIEDSSHKLLPEMTKEFIEAACAPCSEAGTASSRPPDGAVENSTEVTSRNVSVETPITAESELFANINKHRKEQETFIKMLHVNHQIERLRVKECKKGSALQLRLEELMDQLDLLSFDNPNIKITGLETPPTLMAPIPLDGSLNSWCVINPNWFRVDAIILLRVGGGGFGDQQRISFARTWNTVTDYSDAISPNWGVVQDEPDLFYSIVLTPAFVNLPEPDDAGVSSDVGLWRMTCGSNTGLFNTPTIVDQGLLVSALLPADYAQVEPLTNTSGLVLPLVWKRGASTGAGAFITWQASAHSDATRVVNTMIFGEGLAPVPQTAQVPVKIREPGTNELIAFCQTGDVLTFTPTGINLTVSNTTTPGANILITAFNFGASAFVNTYLGPDTYSAPIETAYTRFTLPATTEGAMALVDPKIFMGQLRNMKGGYVVRQEWRKPILDFSSAADRRPIRFYAKGMSREEMDAFPGGFPDTPDPNFLVATQLLLGTSQALSPGFKIIRSFEIVPPAGSIYGPMARPTPAMDPNAQLICRTIFSETPHTYTEDYNALGKLLSCIKNILRIVPGVLSKAGNITAAVTAAVDKVEL